jgi:hypothetical protein
MTFPVVAREYFAVLLAALQTRQRNPRQIFIVLDTARAIILNRSP